MKIKAAFLTSLGTCLAFALLAPQVHAETLVLFDGEQTPFDNSPGGAFGNFMNVSGNQGLDAGGNGDPTIPGSNDYGIQLVGPSAGPPTVNPFGTGNAARVFDFSSDEKPEVQGELGSVDPVSGEFVSAPLFEPFRIDIDSFNQSVNASTRAIRFRFANSGQSITSEARSAFSISFQADGDTNGKYQGIADTTTDAEGNTVLASNPSDVDTLSTSPIEGPSTATVVANGNLTDQYTYTLFGETRTLNPLSYDLYISGVLLNVSPENPETDIELAQVQDRANGLAFHTERSSGYFPEDGIGRIGFIGSSDANVDPDYIFDNIVLRTGADILAVTTPFGGAGVLGDFDGDGDVDLADLDQYIGNLGQTVAANPGLADLDLDGNGTIEAADFEQHYSTLVDAGGVAGTLAGDANLDGVVDVLADAAALVNNLGNAATSWSEGDFNGDGSVDVLNDAAALVNNLGNSNGGGAAGASTSAVPEPGSVSLLMLAAMGLGVRRKR